MASNPKYCGICDQRHITKPSSDWCSECNQALCIECKDFHALSKASQNHSTIAISNHLALDTSFSQVEGHCLVHDDKYQLFCLSHDCLLCLTCLEEHSRCEGVVRISKLTKDVKTSESFVDTQKNLSDIIRNLSKIQCHLEKNVCDINKQKQLILQEIAQMREKIDSHLDKIEQSLKTDLFKVIDDQFNNTFCKTLQDIKRKKTDTEKYLQQIDDLNRYGSDLQTFFCFREILARTKATDQYLQTLDDDGSLNTVTIFCEIDRNISGFIDKVESLGTIQVQKVPVQLILERSKDKQAQLVGVRSKSVNDIKLKLVHTIKLTDKVTGCCFLPDGKLVLCDRSHDNFVKILNPHGELMSVFSMSPSYDFDVTCLDPQTVAVSSDHNGYRQINVTNVDTNSRRSFYTEGQSYGITHTDNSIIVCVQGKGIQTVDTKSGENTTIVPCKLVSWCYIVSSDNKIYYTNRSDHTVTCCDTAGNIIWTFKDENVVRDPRGIAVDIVGNVYTINRTHKNLIVLSADGKQSRQLLSEDDGLRDPCAIAYDKIKNRLCVANYDTNGFLFDVTF